MKCNDTRRVLSRYLDHELSSTEAAAVEEHLAQCIECRAEHAAQQRIWSLLGRVEPVRSPNLIAAIEARLSAPRGWAALLDSLRPRSIGYALAGVFVVGIFVWAGVWAGSAQHRSAAREHEPTFAELVSDAPPGMEVVAVLDQIGERP